MDMKIKLKRKTKREREREKERGVLQGKVLYILRIGGCGAWHMIEVALMEVIVFITMLFGVTVWANTTNDTMRGSW